jgi:hypothetical protein
MAAPAVVCPPTIPLTIAVHESPAAPTSAITFLRRVRAMSASLIAI